MWSLLTAKKNTRSKAYDIAKPYLKKDVEVEVLDFPMVDLEKNRNLLQKKWKDNAQKASELLQSGKNVGMITLGDPMIYSTYSYLIDDLQEMGESVVTVSGIPSFCASAALLGIPIAQGNESFCVLTGIQSEEEITRALAEFENVIIMKAKGSRDLVNQAIQKHGLQECTYHVTDCGGQQERTDRGYLPEKMSYFTLTIIKNKGR
ncbi:MAG TPA: precorrin-2 C(20)-methyltransferase [Eubacteriaceae bacterium]|nr:precorrin-2 C(20)-methyltransferase [Eubacteriaceae bacterium]